MPVGNPANSFIKRGDDPYAESLIGRQNKICASAHNDGASVLANGADNLQKVTQINSWIEIMLFNQ